MPRYFFNHIYLFLLFRAELEKIHYNPLKEGLVLKTEFNFLDKVFWTPPLYLQLCICNLFITRMLSPILLAAQLHSPRPGTQMFSSVWGVWAEHCG